MLKAVKEAVASPRGRGLDQTVTENVLSVSVALIWTRAGSALRILQAMKVLVARQHRFSRRAMASSSDRATSPVTAGSDCSLDSIVTCPVGVTRVPQGSHARSG